MTTPMLVLAVLLAQSAATHLTPEEFLKRVCPPVPQHRLSADEEAILASVAAHYRQFEWSSAEARRSGTFAPVSLARHAVPSLKAPQVLSARTIVWSEAFDLAAEEEMERHGVPKALGDELRRTIREGNVTPFDLVKPAAWHGPMLTCAERFGALAMQPPKTSIPAKDLVNVRKAITISIPAFDANRTHALIVSVNAPSYLSGDGARDVEMIFLAKKGAAWTIEWDAAFFDCVGRATHAEAATARDFAVFDAVLAQLDRTMIDRTKPVLVVNQTRTWVPIQSLVDRAFLSAAPREAQAMEQRNRTCAFIGAYAPKRVFHLVQREALEPLSKTPANNGAAAIRFTLPGYADTTALVAWNLARPVTGGIERGEGAMLLRNMQGTWRVERETYYKSLTEPR